MRWRNIGPYRAGRTKAAAGHASQPYTFYIGMVNGGVWKTTDAGRTWKPIFDDQPTGSIGWVAVAPSDPNILYVGSGEGLPRPDLAVGDGIYKSTDAGTTWTHLGLRDAQQIPKLAIDPKNPNRLFVAALGHPYGPNEERGIFRSHRRRPDLRARPVQGREHRRQGRRHRSLQPRHRLRDDVGAAAGAVGERRLGRHQRRHLQVDRRRHDLEAADAGAARRASSTPSSRSRRAIRGGSTRRSKREAAAPGSTDRTTPARPGRAAPPTRGRPAASTKPCRTCTRRIPDTLIVTDIVSYKSTDGGKTFVPFKGAPGGDDNQNIWWNPNDPEHHAARRRSGRGRHAERRPDVELVVHAADRGALSRDGRQRVSVSRLRRTAGQRIGVRREPRQRRPDHVPRLASGRRRGIRLRRARSARSRSGLRRQGDALRPAHRSGVERRPGRRRAGRARAAGPAYRTVRTQPVVFSTVDPRALFYGNNVLWKTIDGGINWKQISPDLTREKWDVPKSVGTYASRVERARARRDRRAGDLHDRAVVHGHQPHLDRHRRRRDRHHRRRRAALDERHAAAADRRS